MSGSGDYISREAAFEECDWYANEFSECEYAIMPLKGALEILPAADVREVKRCKDCIYAYPYGLEIKCTKHSGHSEKFGEDASYSEFHDWNWFCADAQERRKK